MDNGTRPGDGLLNRYLPNASEEEREEAREIFGRYALHLIAIGERLIREHEQRIDSTETPRRPKIGATPPESPDV
jgi:hypothetical protein